MNHKITIKDLGPIKEIKNFEVKKINAVIGESAAGKSLLAKAIYAFNEPNFVGMLTQGVPRAKRELRFSIQRILGPYKNFNIQYNYGNGYFIFVFTQDKSITGRRIMVEFSKKLEEDIMEVKTEIEQIQTNAKIKNLQETLIKLEKSNDENYRRLVEEAMDDLDEISEDNTGLKEQFIKKDRFLKNLGILNTIFIPATRGFLSDFDALRLKDINRHAYYTNYRSYGNQFISPRIHPNNDVTLTIFSDTYETYIRNFEELTHKLMRGNVKKIEGRTLKFTVDNQVLNMFEISSGQKELFPILMILQEIEKRKASCLIIIEEPEAHIFPTDQALILNRIIEVANKTNSKIFLTTHSPYILMAMNNLIEANTSDYKKLKNKNMYIDFDEANLQSLARGNSKSILDKKNKLINMSYIEKIELDMINEFRKILHSNDN